MESKISSLPTGLLAGKTVFVTGAGAGIGRAIALETASQGAAVFFADIDTARCEKLRTELLKLGAQTTGFTADLSREDEIKKLHAQLKKADAKIDTLINNVGIEDFKQADSKHWWQNWQRVYNTNILGPCFLTRLLVDDMIENKISGSVLFLSSIHQQQVRGDAAYSSSKAALGMIVRELAMELAPRGIRVNGIAPGFVGEDESGNTIPHRLTPLGAASILPHIIGRAAVYLSSEYFSNCTTGSILTLDGGLSLHNHLTLPAAGSTPSAASPLHSMARKFRRAIGPRAL